jgi:hypothetical protein
VRNNKASTPLKIAWTQEMVDDISTLVPTDWSEMMERELVGEIKRKQRAKFMEEFL